MKKDSLSGSRLVAYDRARDVNLIAGVDEVGRACLAGPIVAAGVLFDFQHLGAEGGSELLEEIDDSKRVGRTKRERLAEAILAHAEVVSLVSILPRQIDRIGIDRANVACLEGALRAVADRAELCLVDGLIPLGAGAPEHERLVRGDGTSATVAAASIVAKVARDRFMARQGERYPSYGFERHAGYATPEHKAVLAKLGPCPEHRVTFTTTERPRGAPARPIRAQRRATWRELSASEMAAHLLETPTISDRLWTDEPRLPREARSAFIRRVLLGDSEADRSP